MGLSLDRCRLRDARLSDDTAQTGHSKDRPAPSAPRTGGCPPLLLNEQSSSRVGALCVSPRRDH